MIDRIWIVSTGAYENWGPVAAFTSEAAAEAACAAHNAPYEKRKQAGEYVGMDSTADVTGPYPLDPPLTSSIYDGAKTLKQG